MGAAASGTRAEPSGAADAVEESPPFRNAVLVKTPLQGKSLASPPLLGAVSMSGSTRLVLRQYSAPPVHFCPALRPPGDLAGARTRPVTTSPSPGGPASASPSPAVHSPPGPRRPPRARPAVPRGFSRYTAGPSRERPPSNVTEARPPGRGPAPSLADSAQPSIRVRGQLCREACTYASTGRRQNGPWLLCRDTVLPKEGAGPRLGSQLRRRVLPWASPAAHAGEHGALGAPPTGTQAQEVAPIRGPASLRRPLLSFSGEDAGQPCFHPRHSPHRPVAPCPQLWKRPPSLGLEEAAPPRARSHDTADGQASSCNTPLTS
ncbi:vegetative cell wall protein gp1-like [Prionailurus viverrinus]|uniref:vegetative cell wall protein gp1-like n=1 Tax=Prionailurus viverrinus TaxID=61388 RepID=UPI001FF475CB|nr:vegetative cell wall protein gp1-like [Prionailurus viverrinus]